MFGGLLAQDRARCRVTGLHRRKIPPVSEADARASGGQPVHVEHEGRGRNLLRGSDRHSLQMNLETAILDRVPLDRENQRIFRNYLATPFHYPSKFEKLPNHTSLNL